MSHDSIVCMSYLVQSSSHMITAFTLKHYTGSVSDS